MKHSNERQQTAVSDLMKKDSEVKVEANEETAAEIGTGERKGQEEAITASTNGRISRRKLLASLGAASIVLASEGLLRSSSRLVSADNNDDDDDDDDNGNSMEQNTSCGWYNVRTFGAAGDGITNDYSAINDAISAAKATGGVVYFPPGTYAIDIYLSELRQETAVTVQDLHHIVLMGDGRSSIIKGVSAIGFDVFQLNGVKNATIRDLAITSVKTNANDTTHGCNGISMTNGTSHITIENVHVYDLPHVVKSNYVDGGKAFTIQQGSGGGQACSHIAIRNSECTGCAIGFGMDLNGSSTEIPHEITVSGNMLHAFYRGMYVSASASSSGNYIEMLSCQLTGNTVVGAQYSLVLGRGSGVVATNNQFINHHTSAGTEVYFDTGIIPIAISGTDSCVIANNFIYYAYSEQFMLLDNLYSGYSRQCQVLNNQFTGASNGYGVKLLNTSSSGYARQCVFVGNTFRNAAMGDYDPVVFAEGVSNVVVSDAASRFQSIGVKTNGVPSGADAVINGSLGFAYTDGKTAHNHVYRSGVALAVKQTASSSGTAEVIKLLSHQDQPLLTVLNNGALQLSAIESASIPANQTKRIAIYHSDGSLAGYIPLYNSQ
ncbi:glycoside hydrolase family 55 protein [Paenibacillus sp. J5C_2022]|uniref:glycoside hydrolase family 55 protein n=1 Tax=Paenibacillus sp. J5C2022 TaxID=2977129 RepID=UPI0021D28EEC|nr:glycoside hydrolase family 55 protein [Paenibacillus sp. J5C2022]MCU6712191.1 glycoside hydrolase family 55 protein [Paenibacillus sp. J5C2022]